MRGEDQTQYQLFGYVSLEERVPQDHPLRPIRAMADEALKALDGRFHSLHDEDGRKSIPPEQLLRALLLQMLYSIRSERILIEQMQYNLLYRWFVGLSMDDEVWHPTVFTENRDRLLEGKIAEEFFRVVLRQARRKRLLSDEHFAVDGTLIEAWAGQKNFQLENDDSILKPPPPPDQGSNPAINYRKQKSSNDTDPLARLYAGDGHGQA
jgi:transposase